MDEKSRQPEPPETPRKKGGGDGKAKGAEPKREPAKSGGETSSAQEATQSGMRSRKITSTGG